METKNDNLPPCGYRVGKQFAGVASLPMVNCTSPRVHSASGSVPASLCQTCRHRDEKAEPGPLKHPTNSPLARRPPCSHLGRVEARTDGNGKECNCPGKWVHVCEVHNFCSTATARPGMPCCRTCKDYLPAEVDVAEEFDRVVVVNLRRRADRYADFLGRVHKDWPFKHPQRFEGVDGHAVPKPDSWKAGSGAWGCMQSHRQVLERAIMDGVKSILVLEDDAVFCEDFSAKAALFLSLVPQDWDGLMFGGQHMETPVILDDFPGVLRCRNAQRTHAYAVRGPYLKLLYQAWISGEGHCDHVMGPLHASWRVYAPDPFLVGQAEGKSDINHKDNGERFWQPTLRLKEGSQ